MTIVGVDTGFRTYLMSRNLQASQISQTRQPCVNCVKLVNLINFFNGQPYRLFHFN